MTDFGHTIGDARKRADCGAEAVDLITANLVTELQRQAEECSQGPWVEDEQPSMVPPVLLNVDGHINLTALARAVLAGMDGD